MNEYKKKIVKGAIIGMLAGTTITAGTVMTLSGYDANVKHRAAVRESMPEQPINIEMLEDIKNPTVYEDFDLYKEVKEYVYSKPKSEEKQSSDLAYNALTILLGGVAGLTLGARFAEMHEYEKQQKQQLLNLNEAEEEKEL